MLETLDLDLSLDKKTYRHELGHYQLALRDLAFRLYQERRTLVVVYEGWDAAGKGGSIRRLTHLLDPRGFHVYSIGVPAGEDRERHYLWRFWRRLKPPEEKQVVIFDRSWYGRVLVERIEGFAREAEWKRAYREINEFERQMVEAGILMAKFWLHISADEQLRRFEARRNSPTKEWKLTEEDWRNRDQWELYEQAVEDMVLKTSTLWAPWTLVEANDKYFARVKVLKHLVEVLVAEFGEVEAPKDGKKKNKKKK